MISLFSKFFILSNLFIFTLLSLFFTDLIIIWFFMEITNFLFIYLLNMSMKNKKMIFFYFIIQIIPSFFIMYTMIFNNLFIYNNMSHISIIMALMMKLSIPPFHLWLPLISKYLNWQMLLTLLTIMKITPFYIMSLIYINSMLIYLILILCSIIPPYMLINLNNLKMILSYSSINQTGWMILLILFKNIIWLKYFMFYSLIIMNLFIIMNYFKLFINYSNNNMKISNNLLNMMFIFNMAGMPPFSFFYMKWFTIFLIMYNSKYFLIMIILMFSSFFMLFIYTNMFIHSLFLFKFKSKMLSLKLPMSNNLITQFLYLSLFLSPILFII
nr:NADH dehydrogenase subunit 2 [Monomorium triviale]